LPPTPNGSDPPGWAENAKKDDPMRRCRPRPRNDQPRSRGPQKAWPLFRPRVFLSFSLPRRGSPPGPTPTPPHFLPVCFRVRPPAPNKFFTSAGGGFGKRNGPGGSMRKRKMGQRRCSSVTRRAGGRPFGKITPYPPLRERLPPAQGRKKDETGVRSLVPPWCTGRALGVSEVGGSPMGNVWGNWPAGIKFSWATRGLCPWGWIPSRSLLPAGKPKSLRLRPKFFSPMPRDGTHGAPPPWVPDIAANDLKKKPNAGPGFGSGLGGARVTPETRSPRNRIGGRRSLRRLRTKRLAWALIRIPMWFPAFCRDSMLGAGCPPPTTRGCVYSIVPLGADRRGK